MSAPQRLQQSTHFAFVELQKIHNFIVFPCATLQFLLSLVLLSELEE